MVGDIESASSMFKKKMPIKVRVDKEQSQLHRKGVYTVVGYLCTMNSLVFRTLP